ncbi:MULTISPECIES: hypothetical protein [Streptomyces]|uniref:hypothetical protein n=1 Tax=Streptomyces TaxID=1883 RepID=UPI0007CD594D|nr:hypothetical protein A4V12_13950 [Streptomyces noursei]
MLDNSDEKATLTIETIESLKPGHVGGNDDIAVCVVRCIEGTARLGMLFQHPGGATGDADTVAAKLRLSSIEWYGKQVDQLDTVHSGKVTLTGVGAATLSRRDVLSSVAHG